MKKNVYFQTVFRRDNIIKNFIYDSVLKIASYPKLLIEVFIRQNMGQRYFRVSSALTVVVLMILLPPIFYVIGNLSSTPEYGYFVESSRSIFWKHYWSWYLLIPVFMFFAYLRYREIKHNPSVFDFARFSLYTGDNLSFIDDLKILGKKPSQRTIEIFIEPAMVLIIGIILLLLKQSLGKLLIVSSLCYGISYAGQYKKGDDFVMDKIDEMLVNEEMENAFVNDMPADNTRGVRFHAKKPKSKMLRQKLADSFVENDQAIEEPTYAE